MQKRHIFIILGALILLSGIVFAQSMILKGSSEKGLDDPYLYVSLGDFLYKNGFEDQAVSAYNKALEMDPENKEALNNLGYHYRELNPLQSEEYFIKALESDENYGKARNNLALLYNKLQKYDMAVEHLRVLAASDSGNINYNYDLAINLANKYYYQTRDYEDLSEAISYFKIVYEKDRNFEHAFENIKVLEDIRKLYD